ncbi:fungal-specific transcription factor domain-containing protein [Phlyctochytrium arcticum]|nr:fungal-specific transcription factor domain-containing protein [Phlyctochytrium arcticum]
MDEVDEGSASPQLSQDNGAAADPQSYPHLYSNVPLRRTRSTRACDTCRRKRTKCSGGRPCEGCIAFGLPCAYTAPQRKRGPPKRAEASKSQQSTLGERLRTVESLLSGLIHGGGPLSKQAHAISISSASAASIAAAAAAVAAASSPDGTAKVATPSVLAGTKRRNGGERKPRARSGSDLARSTSEMSEEEDYYYGPEGQEEQEDEEDEQQDEDDDENELGDFDNDGNDGNDDGENSDNADGGGGFRGIALAIHRPRGREVATAIATSLDEVTSPVEGPPEPGPTFCQVPWRAGVTVSDPDSKIVLQNPNDEQLIAHRFNNSAGNITILEDVVTDTVLFYGSTCTSNTNALRESPRFNDGIMSIALRSDVVPANTVVSLDSPPCSPDLVYHLVSIYFTHVHPYLPMVDRVAFTRQLKEKQTEHFSLLLNSMCALVTQQTRSLSAWGISSSSELHRAFFERARALLGKQFDWPHVHNVQALLLLTLVGAGTNTNAASYQYIGIAHRHAIELGMHRNLEKLNHPGLDKSMKEQMRATWFCLYILDRYTGVHQGRPFAINDDDWDTPLPRQQDSPDLARMVRHVTLCSILGKIANYVNRPTIGRKSRSSRELIVREIDGELEQWQSTLPVELQADPPRASGSWSFHHHMRVMYHTAVILLHRIATGRFDDSCVASAIAIRQTLEALPTYTPSSSSADPYTYVFVMPIVVYAGLTASTLFLDLILDRRTPKQAPNRKRPKTEPDAESPTPTESSQYEEIDPRGINAIEELKQSLPVFDKLKDTSMFAVYYGTLIAECVRSNGLGARKGGNAPGSNPASAATNPQNTDQGAKPRASTASSGQQKSSAASASASASNINGFNSAAQSSSASDIFGNSHQPFATNQQDLSLPTGSANPYAPPSDNTYFVPPPNINALPHFATSAQGYPTVDPSGMQHPFFVAMMQQQQQQFQQHQQQQQGYNNNRATPVSASFARVPPQSSQSHQQQHQQQQSQQQAYPSYSATQSNPYNTFPFQNPNIFIPQSQPLHQDPLAPTSQSGFAAPAPFFGDSIFNELLNPLMDPSWSTGGTWADLSQLDSVIAQSPSSTASHILSPPAQTPTSPPVADSPSPMIPLSALASTVPPSGPSAPSPSSDATPNQGPNGNSKSSSKMKGKAG